MIFRGRKGNILPMNCVPKNGILHDHLQYTIDFSLRRHIEICYSLENLFVSSFTIVVRKKYMTEYKRLFFIPIYSNNNDFLCPFSHFLIQESSLVCVILKVTERENFQCRNKARTKKAIVQRRIDSRTYRRSKIIILLSLSCCSLSLTLLLYL